jgi:hypothetical protein
LRVLEEDQCLVPGVRMREFEPVDVDHIFRSGWLKQQRIANLEPFALNRYDSGKENKPAPLDGEYVLDGEKASSHTNSVPLGKQVTRSD